MDLLRPEGAAAACEHPGEDSGTCPQFPYAPWWLLRKYMVQAVRAVLCLGGGIGEGLPMVVCRFWQHLSWRGAAAAWLTPYLQ